jgi:hypothetical protein
MQGGAEFRTLLEAGDVDALRGAWAMAAPHLPQPETREDAEIVMHHARTTAESISFRKRAYSHAWLTERALPSGLPDELRPRAERMYPVVVSAVGISVNTKNEFLKPVIAEVRGAMEHAVLEAEADGKLKDSEHVQQRMFEARERTYRQLLGG